MAALYPVLIPRQLFSTAPSALLDESVRPATALSQLSPADRLFGWVGQGDSGQYKGQLRIGSTHCPEGANAIERVGDARGVPLVILGAPKPSQARFYGANDRQGTPYPRGTDKAAMYCPNHGLRGRKVYPHHKAQSDVNDYWDVSANPPLLNSQPGQPRLYREWRLPANAAAQRSDQNRSITAWVRPGVKFCFDLQVTNVSTVELGALLWLLSLDNDCYLRMGGGKPLGFGSVRLSVVEPAGLDLRDGAAIRSDYARFGGPSTAEGRRLRSNDDVQALIAVYRGDLPIALRSPHAAFDDLPIIKAFLNASRGGGLPVHYPRTQVAPNPSGENYKWFVANETDSQSRHERYSLPNLAAADRGLWVLK
ncbi:MAG: TIGR03986 family CRISPR-associated RAMP protein [Candidatus Accumulibacter sp.]|uniref:TIGR03986 family CRISPR-associated RAMP protein n=1 Tax=Candidatus Accumulibacter proximus TaxID=2954385 RepID=A0A935UHQ9_9PROT|nr:TIGR03986 family CRISPR-associated RAMP protein [Candidatus Accumulibacter proximus]